MSNNLSEDQVKEALESGYEQSEALLNDKDELDNFCIVWSKKLTICHLLERNFR